MSKIDLQLDFDAIRKRIEEDKKPYKPAVWADMIGVTRNIVSNVHGKIQQKPSLEYIVAVSKATGKSVDYYLWGKEEGHSNAALSDPIVIEHQNLVKKFKNPERGLRLNKGLVELEHLSEEAIREMEIHIQASLSTARAILGRPRYQEPNMDNLDRAINMDINTRVEGGKKRRKSGTDDE